MNIDIDIDIDILNIVIILIICSVKLIFYLQARVIVVPLLVKLTVDNGSKQAQVKKIDDSKVGYYFSFSSRSPSYASSLLKQ